MSFWSDATKIIGAGAGIASGVLKGAGVGKQISPVLDIVSGAIGAFKKPATVAATVPATPLPAPTRVIHAGAKAPVRSLKTNITIGARTPAGAVARAATGKIVQAAGTRVFPGLGSLPALPLSGGTDVVVHADGTATVKKKYRRMNYGNAKAARRAIRRIKGVRKMLQDIEKQLPRRTVRSTTHAHAHTHRRKR